MHVVMTAAHGGYDSESVPLGGGAAVCERLCRLWQGRPDVKVTLLGSGPRAPEGVDYVRVGSLGEAIPSQLSELAYARFCRRFEKEATAWLLDQRERPVVLSHDVSEGPDFGRLSRAGLSCLCILHVDVVDYFQRFYLGDALPPFWWTWMHRQLRWFPCPDVLRLVFEKQLLAAEHCRTLVVPSQRMLGILEGCYPAMPEGRVQVVPWGAPCTMPAIEEIRAAQEQLARQWQLDPRAPLILTLSRIAPEKSQDTLLRALKLGEERGQIPAGLTVAIVGGSSYMMGQRFLQRLKQLASRLKRVRVLFPGHLGGALKWAALQRAQVFAVCSRHESYGLTIMEAMAAGCPTVAVRSYGVDAVTDEDCACVLARGPALESRLWEAIRQLLDHPEQRERLATQALRRASEEGFEAAADRLLQLCRGSHR